MIKNNLKKVFFVICFIALGFLILSQFDKTREMEDEKMPSFYDAKINAEVNENLESGYLFDVSNKTYKPGTYHYVIQAKQNDNRIEFLSDEEHSNFEDSITFSWRQTRPPYTVIKKAKADTLYIIKEGRKIAFPKYLIKNN
jgi:hypothetical protein